MTCYNVKGAELNQKIIAGVDPLQAEVETVQIYKVLDGGVIEMARPKINNASFRDVYNFMKSEAYTDEVKMMIKPLASLITEEEAVRDYLTHGRLRTVSEILQTEETEEYDDFIQSSFGLEPLLEKTNRESALKFANQLADKLGLDYNVISVVEFNNIFPERNPKTNPAFFLNGQIYFVEGYITPETVFHEFSHPVVKALRVDNPELFDNLVSEAINEPQYDEIVRALRSDQTLEDGSNEFNQELLVRIMESNFKNPQPTSFMSKLLFALRQFLRKVFGKNIDISKLKSGTTISELAGLLEKGGEFKFTEAFITKDDIAEFKTMGEDFLKGIEEQRSEITQEYLNKFYALVNDQVGYLKSNNPVYEFASLGLTDETNTGQFDRMRTTLNNLATLINNRSNQSLQSLDLSVDSEAEYFKNKIDTYANMFADIDVTIDLFQNKIDSLDQMTDKKSDSFFDSILGMSNILNGWVEHYQNLISNTSSTIQGGLSNPYYQTLSTQLNQMSMMQSKINTMQKNATVDLLYEHYQKLNEPIIAQLKSEMDHFEREGLTESYNRAYESLYGISLVERAELRALQLKDELNFEETNRRDQLVSYTENGYDLSRDAFERIFSGQSVDSSRLSRMFENYSSNQDAVVSSFYKLLQNSLNQVSSKVESNMNSFLKGLEPLLKAAGMNNKVFGEGNVGRAIRQISRGYSYKDGEVTEFDEVNMLSNFKDWTFDLEVLKNKASLAKKNWVYTGKDSDYMEYIKADQALKQFQRNYMNREFADEVYEAEKVFESPAGRKALIEKNKVFDKINLVNNYLSADPSNEGFKKALVEAWEEYRYLFSEYDRKGSLKTGDGLEIAKILQEYKELSRDYYEWTEVPNQFEIAFESFMLEIEADENTTDPVKLEKIADWLRINTTSKVSDAYYEERKSLLDRQKEILSVLNEHNASLGITELYDELYSIIGTSRDEFNVIDGRLMSPEKQRRILEIHNEINKLYDFVINPKGFSRSEVKEYQRLVLRRSNDEVLTPNEMEFLNNYEESSNMLSESYLLGIGFGEIKELVSIRERLLEMTESVSTDNYVNEFHRILSESPVKNEYYNFVSNISGLDLYDSDMPTGQVIDDIIHNNAELLDSWMSKDPILKSWVLRNHYIDDHIAIYSDTGYLENILTGYRKTSAWKTSKPKAQSHYESKSVGLLSLLPSQFKDGGSLVLDGGKVVPNNQYNVRTIKPEFVREKIERDYIDDSGNLVLANVDNRGNWLPKDYDGSQSGAIDNKYIDSNYKDLFKNNRPLFDLLEYLKDFQLKSESKLSNSSKLYLRFPSFRYGSAEDLYGIGTKDFFKRRAMRIGQVFSKTSDDNELGVYTGQEEENPYVTYSRPIRGNYTIESADVSNNIVSSLLQRMESIQEYETIREKSSMTEVVERSMKFAILNPELQSFSEKYNSLKKYGSEKVLNEVERFKSIQKIIEKHVDGISLTGNKLFGKDRGVGRFFIVALSKLQKRLSKMAFAFNLISSFKNYFGGKFQMYKKAIGENGYNLYDLIATRGISASYVGKMITQRYKNTNLPVQMQLLNALNAIPNKLKENVSTYGSRTFIQDIASLNFSTVDRKYLSDSVPVHQIYALMHGRKVMVNGIEKPLYDLVELNDEGLLQTKAGVPEDWKIQQSNDGEITLGSSILKLMAEHDSLLTKNMGISSMHSEPDAYRSLLGKIVFTMQKFFLGMLMDRYQFKFSKVSARKGGLLNKMKFERRRNLDTGNLEYGTYMSILVLMQEALERKGSFWKARTYSEAAVRGVYQLLIGIGLQIMLSLAQRSVGFDQDDDDTEDYKFDPEAPEIFSRLKNSTSLPSLPFISKLRTVEGTGNSFNGENYMKLQVLNLMKGVKDEEATFNPLNTVKTAGGLALMNSALQEGGLVKELFSAINLTTSPEDKQVYSKASGPYVWSEKGDDKILNMGMKVVFGFNGSMIDPATSLKNKYNPLF